MNYQAVAACWGSADGAKLARHLQPVPGIQNLV